MIVYLCIWEDGSYCEIGELHKVSFCKLDNFKLTKIDLKDTPDIPNIAKMRQVYKTLAEVALLV